MVLDCWSGTDPSGYDRGGGTKVRYDRGRARSPERSDAKLRPPGMERRLRGLGTGRVFCTMRPAERSTPVIDQLERCGRCIRCVCSDNLGVAS